MRSSSSTRSRICPVSSGVGAVRCNVLVVRGFISWCFLSYTLCVLFSYTGLCFEGRFHSSLEDSWRLRNNAGWIYLPESVLKLSELSPDVCQLNPSLFFSSCDRYVIYGWHLVLFTLRIERNLQKFMIYRSSWRWSIYNLLRNIAVSVTLLMDDPLH